MSLLASAHQTSGAFLIREVYKGAIGDEIVYDFDVAKVGGLNEPR